MRTNSVVLIYVLILKSSPHIFPNNLQQLSVLVCFWHLPCHCQDVETPRAVDCGPCSAQTNLLSDGKNCSASWGFSLSLSVCQCLFLVAAEFTMSTTLTRMDRMDLSHFRTFAYPLQHLATLQPKHPACADLRDASLSSCSGTTWHTSMSQKSSLPFRRFWCQGHLIPPQAAWSSATLHHLRNVIVSRCRGMQARRFVTFVSFSGRQGRLRFESIFEANTAWPSIDRIRHASVWIPSTESVLSVLWLSFGEKRQFWWEVSSEYFEHFSIRVSTRSCCTASHVVSWQSPQGLWTSLRALHSLNKARAKWNNNELQNSEVDVSNYIQNHWTLFCSHNNCINSY